MYTGVGLHPGQLFVSGGSSQEKLESVAYGSVKWNISVKWSVNIS